MTTDKHPTDNTRLYGLLQRIGQGVDELHSLTRGLYDSVRDLGERADSIYDVVIRHNANGYDPVADGFLDEPED